MSPIFLPDAANQKVLNTLSKLLLALHNILLANASERVEFYTPDSHSKKDKTKVLKTNGSSM